MPGYDRLRDLPRLVPLPAADLEVSTPERHARLLGLLRRALRAERRRGEAGHWAYDLGRHAALLGAYRIEQAEWLARRAGAADGKRRAGLPRARTQA